MRSFATFLLSAVIAAQAATAGPIRARTPYAVKETHFAPREWKKLDRANGESIIQLQIGLTQGNFEELERHLYEVSDPSHARYGKHLTAEEVNECVKPKEETTKQVLEWLSENGIEPAGTTSAQDWIIVHLPIKDVERLLDTEYHNYRHDDGHLIARATHWSLPRHLHSHIDTIQPTNSFFHAAAQKADWVVTDKAVAPASYKKPSDPAVAQVCNVTSVTPECFATLYKTKGYKAKGGRKSSVGFTNYLGEIPIRPDTKLFLQKYRPEAVSSADTFKQYSIDNGPVQDGPLTYNQSTVEGISREANLDVQAISGISWPIKITSYSTGGEPPFVPDLSTPTNTNEPYLAWVNWLLEQDSFPKVISTSYGEPEQSVPPSYAKRVCAQFARVGARGTSLLFSSGDRGVGGTGKCFSNDGKNTFKFLSNFPVSCPYVTGVGATMNFEPEESAYRAARNVSGVFRDLYSSGSGFSTYFKRPRYQEDVVSEYVDNLDGQYDGLYDKEGRGYPDISAQGLYFAYFWNGTEGTISGTSASTPLTSGIIALVNDARIAKGKPALGFLNPWIYSKGYKGFTDITKGFAYGCTAENKGFPVTEGWDPVTGFGTPNFPELLKQAGVHGHH